MKENSNINKDITNLLLNGCSPYISKMNYDVFTRDFIIECVNNANDMRPVKRIEFPGIIQYHENNSEDAFNDQLTDSIIGITWLNKKTICILTEKKEIILTLEKTPAVIDL